MSLRTEDGRPLRLLNVVDEYTRVAVGFHVARSIGARAVSATARPAVRRARRARRVIRSDNGREFIADELVTWLARQRHRGGGHRPEGLPAAELLRRTVQRHHARRAPRRRAVPLVLEAQVVIARYYASTTLAAHIVAWHAHPLAFDRAERARLAPDEGSDEGGR